MRDEFGVLNRKWVSAIATERHLREQRHPLNAVARQFCFRGHAGECGAVERTVFGVVAAKEAGVDYDAMNDPGQSETDDAPIEPGRSPPPCLPPIHPLAAIGVLALDKNGRPRLKLE